MWEKIRKLIVLSVLGAFCMVCLINTCKSIKTCSGVKNPEWLSGIDSNSLRRGKIVKLKYSCVFDDQLQRSTMLKVWSFFSARVYEKEEYILVAMPKVDDKFLDGVKCFSSVSEADGYAYEDANYLIGRVSALNNYEKNILLGKEERKDEKVVSIPTTEKNTNLTYYLEYLDPPKEKERLWKWLISFLIVAAAFTVQILKYINDVKIDQFFLEIERKNQEAAKKLEEWKKAHDIFD